MGASGSFLTENHVQLYRNQRFYLSFHRAGGKVSLRMTCCKQKFRLRYDCTTQSFKRENLINVVRLFTKP